MSVAWTGRLEALTTDDHAALMRRGADAHAPAPDVSHIGQSVRTGGDDALRALTQKFDGVTIDDIVVPEQALQAALDRIDAGLRTALETARDAIRTFHERTLPPSQREVMNEDGVRAGIRYHPLERIGAYVPGGRAAYPSTVLMTCVPARVAGVAHVVVATPPGPDGAVPDATLAACALAGVDRLVRIGGAQAIFALAHGTASVPRVDAIVGPGNAYVTAAKAAVAGHVVIDAPAGPSEVLVIADGTAQADLVAAELVCQAEHDPAAACIALVETEALADDVIEAVARRAAQEPRRDVIEAALQRAGAVLVSPMPQALAFSDAWAPEHLVLMTADPDADLAVLRHYGSAFLGPHASVAFGDYITGPNHVLPTGGRARAYSALGVDTFLRRASYQSVSAEAARRLAVTTETLAHAEGLEAHASAARARRAPR